jgi:hypothetical protein
MQAAQSLALPGERTSGQDIRQQNGKNQTPLVCSKYKHYAHLMTSIVLAVMSISRILQSSLGPVGLDKMLVDDIGVCLC